MAVDLVIDIENAPGALAEVAAAIAIERLFRERLAIKDVVHLTGLDHGTVRRLRQLETTASPGPEPTPAVARRANGGADAEVA